MAVIIQHGVTCRNTVIVVLTVFKISVITKWSGFRRGHLLASVRARVDGSSQRHIVQLPNK
jgi:hypothetical protein